MAPTANRRPATTSGVAWGPGPFSIEYSSLNGAGQPVSHTVSPLLAAIATHTSRSPRRTRVYSVPPTATTAE